MIAPIQIRKQSDRVLAVGYLTQQLARGKALAKCLLASVAFEDGDIVVLSAVALKPDETTQFESAHTVLSDARWKRITIGEMNARAYPTPRADGQLAGAICSLLSRPGYLGLLENSLAGPSDAWLSRAKSRLLFHDAEVYHAVFGMERDKNRIASAIREAEHPGAFVGAVGRAPSELRSDMVSLCTITGEQLGDFAKTVHSIFVGAYDGEGYLIWTKRSA